MFVMFEYLLCLNMSELVWICLNYYEYLELNRMFDIFEWLNICNVLMSVIFVMFESSHIWIKSCSNLVMFKSMIRIKLWLNQVMFEYLLCLNQVMFEYVGINSNVWYVWIVDAFKYVGIELNVWMFVMFKCLSCLNMLELVCW